MIRPHHIYMTLTTLALGFSLVNITLAGEKENWTVEITPRYTLDRQTKQTIAPIRQRAQFQIAQAESLAVPAPQDEAVAASDSSLPVIRPRFAAAENPATSYQEVYKSIPFNRAEYLANPSYRHEATISLMLDQPYVTNGPKDIPQRVPDAVKMSPWSKTTPWFNSGGNLFPFPGANYGFGFGPYWP